MGILVTHPLARVLVIEDDLALAQTLCLVLSSRGCTARYEQDGEAGVAMISRWLPTLVVVDIHLRGCLSGFDVLRHVQTLHASGYVPYLAAVTGTCEPEEALSSGFDQHLRKPVGVVALAALLERARDVRHVGAC